MQGLRLIPQKIRTIALLLTTGLIAAAILPKAALYGLCVFMVFCSICIMLHICCRQSVTSLNALVCLLLFVLGLCLGAWRISQMPAWRELPPVLKMDKTVLTKARIENLELRTNKWLLDVAVDQVYIQSSWQSIKQIPLRLSWYDNQAAPLQLDVCTYWQLKLRIKSVRDLANPGVASLEQALLAQGINKRGTVVSGLQLADSDQSFIPQSLCWLKQQRQGLQHYLGSLLQGVNYGGFFQALLLGNKTAISSAQWELLKKTGTVHLFVVSGLHISLLAGMCWFLGQGFFRLLLFNRVASTSQDCSPALWQQALAGWPSLLCIAVCSFLLTCLYAVLSGFALPTQRALLMLLFLFIGRLAGGQWPWLNAFLLTLLCVLLYRPVIACSISFQLSFMAVLTILLATKTASFNGSLRYTQKQPQVASSLNADAVDCHDKTKLLGVFRAKLPTLRALLKVQMLLTLLMVSLLSFYGQSLSWAIFLINLFLVPIFSIFILPASFLAFFISLISESLSNTLFIAIDAVLLQLFAASEQLLDSLSDWQAFRLFHLGQVFYTLFCLLLLSFPLWHLRLIACVFLALLYWPLENSLPGFSGSLWQGAYTAKKPLKLGELEFYQFDVGQGMAFFIRTENHRLLYDTAYANQTFSMAQWVLIPALHKLGVDELDVLIVSHDDSDHSGGLSDIYQSLTPRRVLLGQNSIAEPLLKLSTQNLSRDKSDPKAVSLCHGQSWVWDQLEFQILEYNTGSLNYKHHDNNTSCVLLVRPVCAYGEACHEKTPLLLITGDIHKDRERDLLRRYENLSAHVVTIAHHGSKTSSSSEWLHAMHAEWGLVSAGYQHYFGHPHASVVKRWEKANTRLLNTAEDGLIYGRFQLPQESWQVFSYRQLSQPLKPWYWSVYTEPE